MKGWLLGKGLKSFLSGHLERYALLTNVTVDSDAKTIAVIVIPHGEEKETEIKIERYSIRKEDGKHYITIEQATASRLWISNLAEDFLKNKRFEIPNLAGFFL